MDKFLWIKSYDSQGFSKWIPTTTVWVPLGGSKMDPYKSVTAWKQMVPFVV